MSWDANVKNSSKWSTVPQNDTEYATSTAKIRLEAVVPLFPLFCTYTAEELCMPHVRSGSYRLCESAR